MVTQGAKLEWHRIIEVTGKMGISMSPIATASCWVDWVDWRPRQQLATQKHSLVPTVFAVLAASGVLRQA